MTTATATHRINLKQVTDHVANRVKFNANNTLRGTDSQFVGFGRLPMSYRDQFAHDSQADDFYVVLSYETPIAWFARGVWFEPPVKYSPTTSKQANYVRRGMSR